MKKIIFGIGSNLGDRQKNIDDAIDFLVEKLQLKNLKKSEILKNPAMLPDGAPESWNIEFFNIAISADIDVEKFAPLEILKISKEIEKKIGRVERERWAPREIDIDILKIEDLEVEIAGKLTIPHPGINDRDFFVKTVSQV